MPTLKIMDGTAFVLTEDEAAGIGAKLTEGCEFVAVRGALINVKSISGIYPDEITEKDAAFGRLHDGSRVMKRFGRWTDPENPDINISLEHYPEIARDQVMSEAAYQKDIAPLELSIRREAYYRLAGSGEIREARAPRSIDGGMKHIGKVV